jgi:hypothetical protein
MTNFTFDYDIFSDLYKDAYGIRPRCHYFYYESTTDEERQDIWDRTLVALDETIERERLEKESAEAEFKATLQKAIALGAGDEETALRWLVQDEKFYSGQDVEHWVYNHGILFTDYGKALVNKIEHLVEYSV